MGSLTSSPLGRGSLRSLLIYGRETRSWVAEAAAFSSLKMMTTLFPPSGADAFLPGLQIFLCLILNWIVCAKVLASSSGPAGQC